MGTVPNTVAERISPATRRKIMELATEYECAGSAMTRAFMRDKHIQAAKDAYASAYVDLYQAVMAVTDHALDDTVNATGSSRCERG